MSETAIYVNGHIYTVAGSDWETKPKQAIVVQDGVITYVGTHEEAYTYEEDGRCNVYDLEGCTVIPGIHDVHMHPLEASSEVGGTCELKTGVSPEKMIRAIKKQATKQKGTDWVLGHGYSIDAMFEHIAKGGRSPRLILDEAIPNKPAIMMEETSHSVWVNSAALQIAGIDSSTPCRSGGIIMRDDSGEPNGLLFENEGIEIMDIAMSPTPKLEKFNYEGLLYGLEQLRRNGITSICDARVFWKQNHHKAWQKACKEQKLTARAVLCFWVYPNMNDDEQIERLKSFNCDYHCENKCFLRQNQIKMYSDGLLQSTTAALLKQYVKTINLEGLEENIGMNYFSQDRLQKYLKNLQNFGDENQYDFHVHAIGDRAVHEVLNAIESTKIPNTRHRMTHLELIDAADIIRFNELGVTADFQVAGEYAMPSAKRDVEELVGRERAEHYIPVKSVAETGANVTLSSDWDVSILNPFVGIQHAVERGIESVTLKEAVEMYTINGAFTMRQEEIVGTLEEGKEADFVVIDKDIFKIKSSEIGKIRVKLTVLCGNHIYSQTKQFPKRR